MNTQLNEEIKLSGAEAAIAKLRGIASAGERVAKMFGGIAQWGSAIGGLAGAWKVAETIQETDRLYQAVARVKAITGVSAESAHTMFDWFELSGIKMESAENIMTSLARLSGKLGDGFAGTAEQVQTAQRLMTRLGISIKAGPQQRLLEMATAAQKGRLQINDLIRGFNVSRGDASQMMAMLRQGPERLRELAKDTLNSSDLINEGALQSHQRMVQARRELGDAWGGLVGTLYKALLPAVTTILNNIKRGFEEVSPVVEAIGSGLAKHMTTVVTLTKTYLGLLAGSKVANMFSGESGQKGIIDRLKQIGGLGFDALTPARYGRKFSPGGGMRELFTIGGRGSFDGASLLVRALSNPIARLGVLGVAVGGVVAAFTFLKNNTMGIRDSLVRTFGSIGERLASIFGQLLKITEPLFEAFKAIAGVVGGALLLAIQAVAGALDVMLWAVDKFISFVRTIFGNVLRSGPLGDMLKKAGVNLDAMDAADAAVTNVKTPDGKPPTVYQDFRGSSFNIENNFPSNVDGGRVAVAFGDQLARLGERRIDSGVRPIYGYR